MKRLLGCVLVFCMVLAFATACAETPIESETTQETVEAFPGKIAIVTNTIDQNEEEFRSGTFMVNRYGEDKIIHRTWPSNFAAEGEQMITILRDIAADPDVGAIIINQACLNTNAAIDAVRAMRGTDIFIASISAAEDPADVGARVNLALDVNNLILGKPIVEQAVAMGADTFVHYSFPRHLGIPMIAYRRDVMRDTAEELGIRFVELNAPDPTGDGGQAATMMHIMQDLPRQVETYGANTAFFGTNCAMQTPLIQQTLETGAIYPQPCCPSPYHGFPGTLGIADQLPSGEVDGDGNEIMVRRNISEVVEATRQAIHAKGMENRLSSWPVPATMMWAAIATEYAIAWLNGQVPQDFGVIDLNLLSKLSEDFIFSLYGPNDIGGANLEVFDMDGLRIEHYFLGTMGFLVY